MRPISKKELQNLSPVELDIIMDISHVYTRLEHLALRDANNLTDDGKANIRRAQGEIQRARLKLLDLFNKNGKKETNK